MWTTAKRGAQGDTDDWQHISPCQSRTACRTWQVPPCVQLSHSFHTFKNIVARRVFFPASREPRTLRKRENSAPCVCRFGWLPAPDRPRTRWHILHSLMSMRSGALSTNNEGAALSLCGRETIQSWENNECKFWIKTILQCYMERASASEYLQRQKANNSRKIQVTYLVF